MRQKIEITKDGHHPNDDAEHVTIRMRRVNREHSAPPLGGYPASLKEAREAIKGLVQSIGEYETVTDEARAIALILTPMVVMQGALTTAECPSYEITPRSASLIFKDILDSIYGEHIANQGCKIL